jgi:hypothetical protein
MFKPIELEMASTSCFGAGSGFTSTGSAFLASTTSSLGACRVCGSDGGMTFAACETVDDPVVVTAEVVSEAPTFGSLDFGSLPGVADPLDGVVAALLVGGTSPVAELGATSAADGGTEPTDAVAEALAVAAAADGA